jgi:beta-glucanase (GH16 family)
MRASVGAVLAAVLALVLTACSASETGDGSSVPGFADEFDGSALNTSLWNTCHWWDDGGCTIESNDEMQWYLPSQVAIENGELLLTAERADTPGTDGEVYPYRSGMITSGPPDDDSAAKFAFTYGTVEARVQVPAGVGLWAALWLLPASTESRPEIDLLEVLGNNPSELLMHFHPADRDQESPGSTYTMPAGRSFADGWRDVRLEWEPGHLRYFVDDEQVWEVTGDQVPDEPMYIVANLAVGGEYPGPPDDETVFPASYRIDYIRVRQRAP